MALPERMRIVVPVSLLLLLSGLLCAWMGFPMLFTNPPGVEAFVVGLALFVFAPVLLVEASIGSGSTPGYVAALGLAAIVALPFHAIVRFGWARTVTIGGMVAWMVCQMYV